jgi:hypothetical protein
VKKPIALLCFFALLLSTSAATYFYWMQEQWHESVVFIQIEAGAFDSFENQIKLTVQDKDILPDGYTWEEEGREFTHKGMFYDIISIKKIDAGWLITAASDEAEAEWEANAQKLHTEGQGKEQHNNKSKLSISKVVYDSPIKETAAFNIIDQKIVYCSYPSDIRSVYLVPFSPPPEFA